MKTFLTWQYGVVFALLLLILSACQPIQPPAVEPATGCSDETKIALVQSAIDAIHQKDMQGASAGFSEDGRLWFDNVPELDASSGEYKVTGLLEAQGKEKVAELMGAIISAEVKIHLADIKVNGDTYTARASVTSPVYLELNLPSDTLDQIYTIKFHNCKIIDWNGYYPEDMLKSLKK